VTPVTPRRAASIMSTVLAVLVPLLVAAVGFLVFQNHRQDEELLRQAHSAIQQNVTARYDDCRAGDRLRRALYQQALASSRTMPLLLRLVPSLDTPEFRELAMTARSRQLKAYRPRGTRGCARFALRVVLPKDRSSFRVVP
jgi:hypothetical protein